MTIGMEIGEQRSCSQDNTETRLINYLAKSKVRNESSTMRTVLQEEYLGMNVQSGEGQTEGEESI